MNPYLVSKSSVNSLTPTSYVINPPKSLHHIRLIIGQLILSRTLALFLDGIIFHETKLVIPKTTEKHMRGSQENSVPNNQQSVPA